MEKQLIKEILKLMYFMVKERSYGRMGISMKELSRMDNITGMVNSDGIIQSLNTKVCFKEVKCTAKVYLRILMEYLKVNIKLVFLMVKEWLTFSMVIGIRVIFLLLR